MRKPGCPFRARAFALGPCVTAGPACRLLPGHSSPARGRLAASCANSPRQNASRRPMVEARGGEWEDLPADTFKEVRTGVRVALITMQV